ncbi:uncharacterized protein LOC129597476 [Paramacrobiotus metropolitanus]|uniref:uncharacterized protein LOC129597476 n=1 Tax=Paramacrobiotus metropolitanus TaxID=2943436 RepID=UPI0024464D9C|nr:uncharacterized protein LOC129597476 [Paramacrobiotus metropolitanus]XP_055351019.1 uncharacterized protein LOC129597476 [Paramacrobiotus metropolitanus]
MPTRFLLISTASAQHHGGSLCSMCGIMTNPVYHTELPVTSVWPSAGKLVNRMSSAWQNCSATAVTRTSFFVALLSMFHAVPRSILLISCTPGSLFASFPKNRQTDRICRFPMQKVVYRSAKLRALGDIQEWHIERVLDVGFRHGRRPLEQGRDRVFVRIREDEIMFLNMRIQCGCPPVRGYTCGQSPCWLTATTRKVANGIEKYLFEACGRAELPLYNCQQSDVMVLPPFASEETEVMLPDLPSEILSRVVFYLDTVSQAKAMRVCELWNVLLRDQTLPGVVIIDFCALRPQLQQRAETEGYGLGRLLHRIVNTNTKILALINMSYRADSIDPVISLIADILVLMSIRIPLIIVKNCWAPIKSHLSVYFMKGTLWIIPIGDRLIFHYFS